MIKRPLGNTGIKVSEVAFGGVQIGVPYGIGEENTKIISQKEAINLLHAAMDQGINFFDTARSYGQSEFIMGKAFKDRRDQVVIGTKCVHFLKKDGRVPPFRELERVIKTSLEQSLKELQTDYIDIFMLHEVNMEVLGNENVANIFTDLKQSGLIRATGVSTYTPQETEKAIEAGSWDVIQLPFNLLDQRQQGLFPLASKNGIGVVVRSVLLRGLLSDRSKNLHPALKKIEMNIEKFRDIAGESEILDDLPALATKFPLSFNEVSSILVGIDRMDYLNQALKTADGIYLTDQDVQHIKSFAYPDSDFINLHNWDKEGWLN